MGEEGSPVQIHVITTQKALIFFGSSSPFRLEIVLHPADFTRSDAWVQRMRYWLDHGLRELYFFMHRHDEATSPELTVYLVDKLNKECGLNLIKPKFIENTPPKKNIQKGLLD